MDRRCRATMVVLAAGSSRRMGQDNKLLLRITGSTVLEHTLSAVLAAEPSEVVVVLGPGAEIFQSILSGFPVRVVVNAEHADGMSSSIRAGVAAARGPVGICLADMPFIRPGTISRLLDTLEGHPNRIVVPCYRGVDGHPVLFPEPFRDELLRLEGDTGARTVIQNHPDAVLRVETEDAGILKDIDTPDDYLASQ